MPWHARTSPPTPVPCRAWADALLCALQPSMCRLSDAALLDVLWALPATALLPGPAASHLLPPPPHPHHPQPPSPPGSNGSGSEGASSPGPGSNMEGGSNEAGPAPLRVALPPEAHPPWLLQLLQELALPRRLAALSGRQLVAVLVPLAQVGVPGSQGCCSSPSGPLTLPAARSVARCLLLLLLLACPPACTCTPPRLTHALTPPPAPLPSGARAPARPHDPQRPGCIACTHLPGLPLPHPPAAGPGGVGPGTHAHPDERPGGLAWPLVHTHAAALVRCCKVLAAAWQTRAHFHALSGPCALGSGALACHAAPCAGHAPAAVPLPPPPARRHRHGHCCAGVGRAPGDAPLHAVSSARRGQVQLVVSHTRAQHLPGPPTLAAAGAADN